MPDGPVTTPHGSPMQSRQEWLDALDRAARYYREALRNVIEECANDRPRIGHIREAAERGLAAADHELRPSPRPEHDALRRAEAAEADADKLAQALEQIAGFTVAGGAGNQPHFSTGREIARAALAARNKP